MAIWRFEEPGVDYGQLMTGEYNIPIVILSVVIASGAGYIALVVADRMTQVERKSLKYAWLAVGAIAMGLGIWAMHFTGMLAFEINMPVSYSLSITLFSGLPAILGSALTLNLLSGKTITWRSNQIGAVSLASCIALMHFTGMEAMRMSSILKYDLTYFLMSIIIAHILASLGLYVKYHQFGLTSTIRKYQNYFSAAIFGLSVSGMHYVAMAATRLYVSDAVFLTEDSVSSTALTSSVISIISILLLIVIAVAYIDKRVRDTLHRTRLRAQELMESEAVFRGLLETAPDGMVIVSEMGTIQIVNKQLLKLTGYTVNELIDKPIEVLVPQSFVSHKRLRDEYLIKPDVRTMSERVNKIFVRRKDGTEFSSEISLSPLQTARGLNISVVVRDISEREILEENLRQSQKMELMGQIAGGVAHDFNNLLTVILGNLEFLLEELDDSISNDERTLIINSLNAAQSGARLTYSLLTSSRQDALQPKDVDLSVALTTFIHLASRTLGKQIEIVTNIKKANLIVNVDPHQLENALLNIAINSRDAMPSGGILNVTVTSETISPQQNYDQMPLDEGDYAVISLTDTGIGMSPELIDRAQEVFFTTKGVGEGTGLGLSSVVGFAKQSGGQIQINSTLGEGTNVSIYLPLSDQPIEMNAEVRLGSSLKPGTETILVVDDEPLVRDVATKLLTKAGYKVIEAKNADEAIKILKSSDDIDFLFSDIMMPGSMDGRGLAYWVREHQPRIKILLTSGYFDLSLEIKENGFDAIPLLKKPYRNAELQQEIRTILDS